MFINILIDSKSDTLFQQLGGTYYLVDGSKHCFQDEINVDNFKKVIATFDNYIFQNQEIKNLIQTWGNELEKVLKNDIKTLENKRKTNNNIEIEKKSNGAGSLEDFFYNENDKEKETENVVTKKQNNSKGNNNLTMLDLFKRVKENKKMKTEEGNSSNKGGYFKDSKEEGSKDVKIEDNLDKVNNQTNEGKKKSNSKEEEKELIIDSNSKNNNKEEKNVVLEMDYKPATNHNNNCGGCLTSFKEGLKNCFG